ncbi:cadherin-23-like [Branchiostoma lanceolatum]|uniref:cadherin-23-like n=1 Tax=Branchiostoma lanceolatum TaxID=7740 RepID=UPI0034521F2C
MSLDENQAANAAVFTFTGSDEDQPGDTLTWTLTNQFPSSQFVINSATGSVSTSASPTINYESAETQYLLTVELDDTALTATATLTVNVNDINETPDFTNFPGSTSVDVTEDTAGGVTVQSFTVYDDDNALVATTQDITYTIAIVTPTGETLPFTFDKVNNTNVNLNTDSTATIDYEYLWSTYGTNQYEVTLTVSDGALSSVRTFYINILDVNESPVITNLASSLSTTIDEDQSGGKNLIYFTGTDVDLPGDTMTWSIASQTPNALGMNFEIGSSTGVLSIVSSPNLNYETETQYLLQIELNDGTGAGRLTSTVTYTVNIRDINEAPTFSDTSLTYEIDENTAGGVTICPTSNAACTTTLQGTDPDGDTLTYTLISYSPVEDGYSNPFQLTPSGNDLVIETVTSPELDFERTTAYTLKIRVTDGSTSGSMSSTGEITINLVDLDETPEWRNLPNSVTVSEDLAGNQKVYTVDAVDPEGVSVTYALTTATTAFTLVTGTGEIRTTASPQLESGAFLYTLEIEAADATTNTATSTLTVNVAFYDDSPPVFTSTTYAVNVNEGQSSGTTVTTIAATDTDVGDVVQYYITGGNGYFLVDSAGIITTGTELDRDDGSPSSYTLTLTAYDTSGLSAQATVTVTVDAVNDNAPVFSQGVDSVNVPENTAVSTSVLQLTCADADTGTDGDLVYALDSGNTDNLFALDTSTGLITVSSAIDMEDAAIISSNFKYTLKVTAVDQAAVATDRFTSTATIYVTITGQNEFTPDFTTMPASDTVTLSEDTAVATTVTSNVAATDGDEGSQGDIVYAITGGDTSSPRTFTMNPANGRIVLAQPLDFETTPVYYLELSAIDDASSPLTGTATLTVSVTDVDDASPAFSTDTYEATVGEDQTANAYVVQLTVTDADTAGADMTYSFIAGNTAGNFWLFTLNNTENNPWVMLSNQLDYDTGDDVFTLVVKAQDQSSNTATAQVLIYVNHVNEFQPVWGSPSALPSDSVTVDEDQPIGTTVLTLDVSDSDAGTDGDLTYTITAGNTNSIFELDPKTGELLVSKGLDFETSGGTYNLSIQAVDGGNPARSADSYVLVTIGNVNDNPPSCTQTTYVVQVPEDQTPNLIPGFVNMDCDDGDGDILTDSIISGDPAGTFRITQNGAFFTIYLGSALDYDDPNSTPRSYDLIVQLSDGTTTLEVPVVIGVTPVNEGPPNITDDTVTVSETTPIGDVIYDVDDSDTDADDQAHGIVTYAITGPATHPFRIDSSTGEISVASTLDYETSTSYNLVVVATDGGGLESTATVTVNLDGVNEFYPTCTSSDFGVAVSENANVGNVVVDLGCTDSDSGFDGALTYTATQTPSTKFDVSTGQIQVSTALDYDGGETLYSLVVLVSDNSVIAANQKTTTVTVTIEVSPENEDTPSFSPPAIPVTLSEDISIGSTVIDLDAADTDASNHAHGIVTYSITSGNTDGHFSIDPSSGVIVTTSPLDWETTSLYSLVVRAADGGTPPLSADTTIIIILDDVNDNTAQCVPSVFSETVSESEAANYIVTSLSCTDSDGTFGVLTYSITAGDTNQFYMNGSDLLLTTPLDYDAVPRQYNLEITVADNGSPPNYDVIPVTVHVDPVNEFPPVFVVSGDVVLSVDEDFTVNDPITNVAATDADSDANAHGQITYTILSGNINAKFSMDSATGILYLVDELDRETTASYSILVQASDGVLFNAGTPNTITKWVNITVNDINDNEPQCTPSNYAVTFNESTATGTVMTTVTCQDLFDAGTNAQIQYYFSGSGNVGNTFAIDQTTGQITLQNPLEYDSSSNPQSYSLTVHAIDQGTTKLTGTALVTVAVSPVNEDTPQFSETAYVVSVPEDTSLGTSVLQVITTDTDAGDDGVVRYSMAADNTFLLEETTGWLVLKSALDRESTSSYFLQVTATDQPANPSNALSAEVNVTIIITDVNDNAPVFFTPTYQVTLSENDAVGTLAEWPTAFDFDTGINGNMYYAITGGNTNTDFSINQFGAITTARALDYETTTSYSLTVTATDQGSTPLSATAQVGITITPYNEFDPTFGQASYNIAIDEDTAIGISIGQVTATDADYGSDGLPDDVTYSFAATSTKFYIDEYTGDIRVKGTLDKETQDTYTLTVVATDSGTTPALRSNSVTLTITIGDTNDNAPVFSPAAYTAEVPENATVGYNVVTIVASDSDLGVGGTFDYNIVAGNAPDNIFAVDSSGNLYVTSIAYLDYEATTVYTLSVTATDQGTPQLTSTARVGIQITAYNEFDPVFSNGGYYTATISEGASLGDAVIRTTASDDDDGSDGDVTYLFTSGNSNGNFAIDYVTGWITVDKELDREVTGSYVLTVTAYDGGSSPSRSADATVIVTVDDVNDNAPTCTGYYYDRTLAESVPAGTSLLQLTCSDPDEGVNGDLAYTISSGDLDGQFHVDSTGQLTVSTGLNYENTTEYQITITVSDDGSPSLSTVVIVTMEITGVNEFQPVFTLNPYGVSINENISLATSILAVSAQDQDAGTQGEVKYYITSGNQDGAFSLDYLSGDLSTAAVLNREALDTYVLTVVATDGGTSPQRSGTSTVTVTIEDANDNTPSCLPTYHTVTVPENTAINTVLLTVNCSDNDINENAQLTYTIVNGSDGSIAMSPSNADVYLAASLDYETTDSYYIQVEVSDNGYQSNTATVFVSVEVTGVNEVAPAFVDTSYQVSVAENETAGVVILQVNATDSDIGDDGQFTYSITGGNNAGVFEISATNGEVGIKRRLDREGTDYYVLTVTATDMGSPALSSSVYVYVNVTDVNDNQPTCSAYVVNIELDEDVTVGTTLASFNCTDQDINNNADLSYSIVSGDTTNRFAMVLNQLQVQNSLDFEGDDWYYLTLAVADNGSPALSANITVSVHVNPVNEFTPVYNDSSYSTNLFENITSGTVVVIVGATDADRSDQAQGMVRYSIVSGNSGNTFSIDDETGDISVLRPLDRETTNFYNLTVRVHDNVYGGAPQLFADVQVEIMVLDVDDNPPSFEPESYTVSVVEGAALGSQLAALTYTDADDGVNAISVLSVTSGNGTGIFALIGDTLSLLGALDYETEQQYVLTVQATDVQEPSFTDTAEVIVNVISENDNQPVFAVDNTTINVSEAAAVGTVLYDANATDSDLGEHSDLTYSIVSSSSPTFLIDSVTGIVRLGAALDRETLSSYVVNITAEDTDYYDFMLLYVFVTDVNDNTPAMSNTVYPVTVDENEPIGTVLLTILATDPDEGNNSDITYTTRGSDASFFYLNSTTGDVSSQSTLDFESRKSYYFFVRAYDNGSPQLYSSWSGVQVVLNDLNDNSPVFSPTSYTYTLSEDSLYPIDLLTVYASDADSGTNADITYSIASGDPNNQFQINQDGVVFLVNALDREITPLYFLSITATDGGSPPQVSTPAIVVITVEDANDNAPTFAQASYTEFVDEDAMLYTTVSTPVATDPDDGVNSQITFSILSGNDNNKFSIDPIYGYIFTIGTFDREIQDTYNLTIQAQDGESPFYTATSVVYIRIVDINDNAPVFGQSSYQTNVNENVAVGTSVITVSASDVDNGTNGEVNYYMLDTSVPFTVDNMTGVLYTSGNLDRESVSSYTFLVYVRDQGTPQFSGETTVTVYVLDLNDNTPNFTQTSYSITIEENLAQGTSILTVSATDGDSGTNADITYSISPSSTSGVQFYNIDSTSGQISVREANDRETLDFVQMFVVATDGGSPQLSSSVEVNVTISDVNDNAPILVQTFFSLEIRYDSSSLTNLDTLSATDIDQGINGEIQYYLLDYTSLFHVDLLSGHFRKKDNSTLLEPDFKYVMSAVARDAGSPVLTSDPPATIRVDTFRPEECLVDMVVALTYDQFLQVQDSFIAALSAVFAPGRIGVSDVTTNSGTSRRRLLQSDSVTVSVYGVANTLTDSSSGLTAAKSFMSADEILEVAQLDDSGTPSAAISGQEFLNFPVTQVARSIDNSVTTAATPFVQTPAGIAVLTISAVVGLILLILLLVCCVGFCKRRRKNKVDK